MASPVFSSVSYRETALQDHHLLSIATILLIFCVSLLSLVTLRIAYRDYCSWYTLESGGLPHNVFGWVVQLLLRLFANRDTKSTSCYDDHKYIAQAGRVGSTSFLAEHGGLEVREGERPVVGKWVAPHRQLDQLGTEDVKEVCQRNATPRS